jgi:hypothetical protein
LLANAQTKLGLSESLQYTSVKTDFTTKIYVGMSPVPIGKTDVAAVSSVALSHVASSIITTAMRERCRISTFTWPAAE